MKKRSERRKHCARAGGSKVRTPPARPLQTPESQTGPITIHCAAKLSAQCNNTQTWARLTYVADKIVYVLTLSPIA